MQNEGAHIATITLRGKSGIAALVVLLGVIAGCIVNVWGVAPDDEKMVAVLKSSLMTEYIRSHTDDIKKYMDAGDMKKAAELGAKVSGAKVDIESVKIAYPAIQHFTGKRDVVAKVTYNLIKKGVPGESRTEYYEMHKAPLSESWMCSGKVRHFYYYINLIDDSD